MGAISGGSIFGGPQDPHSGCPEGPPGGAILGVPGDPQKGALRRGPQRGPWRGPAGAPRGRGCTFRRVFNNSPIRDKLKFRFFRFFGHFGVPGIPPRFSIVLKPKIRQNGHFGGFPRVPKIPLPRVPARARISGGPENRGFSGARKRGQKGGFLGPSGPPKKGPFSAPWRVPQNPPK